MATLTPTMRWPVESRTRVTLRNFWRPVVVILVMAFHSGRMQPAKSASVCCRVPKRQKAPGQLGDERAWMHCVWWRGSVYSTCVGVRVHVHMPCVCLLGVAIEAAPSGLGRGEPLLRREVVLLVVARLWGDKQRVSSTALESARTRAAVRGGVRARASSPPPVRLPRISKATRPLFGRSTRYLIRGRGTARDTYRLGLGSGVRG